MTLRASVVVPTYRRPEHIQTCLEALLAQDMDPDSYEIIVVDNAAGEETRRRVDRLAAGSGRSIRYIPAPEQRGPAAARNVGWRSARGQFVAFTDDDCVPAHDWLRCGLAVFLDGVVGASGRVLVPVPARPTDYERNTRCLAQGRFVTANCFYRRDVLEEVVDLWLKLRVDHTATLIAPGYTRSASRKIVMARSSACSSRT